MAGIDRRLEDLEHHFRPAEPRLGEEEDAGARLRRAAMVKILDEVASLKASRAGGSRGGKRIEPEDIPGKLLGPGYTSGEVWELAVRRVFEREITPFGVLDSGTVEDLIETWTRFFREMLESKGRDWNEVAKLGE